MDCKNGYFGLSYFNLNSKYTIVVFWELNGQKYIDWMVITVLDLSHQILKRFLYSLTTNEEKTIQWKITNFQIQS